MATGTVVCPKYFGIYIIKYCSESAPPTTGWIQLPHTQSWTMTPDREDPSEIRTDQTGGNRIKACAGTTSWSFDVTSILALDDYLWCYLFPTETTTFGAGKSVLDINSPATVWAWFTTDSTSAPTGDPDADGGIYCYGFAEIGDFGGDNDSNDPVSTDWTFEVSGGPWMGNACANGTDTQVDVSGLHSACP